MLVVHHTTVMVIKLIILHMLQHVHMIGHVTTKLWCTEAIVPLNEELRV